MTNNIYDSIRPHLYKNTDEKYRVFHAGLIPGIHDFIGVRTPCLRKIARGLTKTLTCEADWSVFLDQTPVLYEEIMIRGITIGLKPVSMIQGDADYQNMVSSQLSYIDNWALCDLFCAGLKQKAFINDSFFEFVLAYMVYSPAAGCWTIRAGLVLLLFYFTDDIHAHRILAACRHTVKRLSDFQYEETFYVRMGTAWLLAEIYIKSREATHEFMFGSDSALNIPDDWTYNKSIQKILESNRISAEEKAELRAKKRPKSNK